MAAKKKTPKKATKPAPAKKKRVVKTVPVPEPFEPDESFVLVDMRLVAEVPPPIFVAAPEDAAVEYRKRMGDATWHLTALCPNWPQNDYVVRSERPTDSLCASCVSLTGG